MPKIRDLMTDESKWCQGAEAWDSEGDSVLADGPSAVARCLLGWIIYCYGRNNCYGRNKGRRFVLIKKVEDYIGMNIVFWNDSTDRTFAEVRKVVEDLDI